MDYTFPTEQDCLAAIKEKFEFLCAVYGYEIIQEKMSRLNVQVIFQNKSAHRKIRVANHTNYTDYGFEVFLFDTEFDLEKPEHIILVNIPFDKQDKTCDFVTRASEFVAHNTVGLITGKEWVQPNRILYKE